ncbi:hypothetical protein INH39_00605 [Massilia violaceinigra]|uniref:Uncharacterized protein n=1 Tax=Massilia violaceinigra TaxID=2045208 RepID=A0ABY4A6J7_9BURK|nr:hypothetical protein [Massilia violaceinigra]UOD30298.1 hypothetical protein INH39_00605 [Massilia violaceinigra]
MSMNAVNSGPAEPENKRALVAGGGGPPYDNDMDHRLIVLETRFDTILPTLATKADLAELRLDFERMFFNLQAKLTDEMNKLRIDVHNGLMNMTKWCVAIAITVILGVAGQSIYLSKQISDLAARLPPPGTPAAAAPHRPSAAQLASASPPQAGAITAPR